MPAGAEAHHSDLKGNSRPGLPWGLALMAGLLCFVLIWGWHHHKSRQQQERAEQAKAVQALFEVHIAQASEEAKRAIGLRALEFQRLMRSFKGSAGAGTFVNEVTSSYGKWRALKPKLPFADGEGNRKFVQDSFNANLFSPDELAQFIRRIMAKSCLDLLGTENELAVKVGHEIPGTNHVPKITAQVEGQGTSRSISRQKNSLNEDEFRRTIDLFAIQLEADANKATAELVASLASWLVDVVLAPVSVWLESPEQKLELMLATRLDEVGRIGAMAIQTQMTRVLANHHQVWEKVAREVIQSTRGENR